MKVEDVFTISSVTKLFTATLVFELAQEGKLRLDDKVTALLPGLPGAWKDITILYCLSHTSGLPDLYEGIRNLPIAYTPTEAVKNRLETAGIQAWREVQIQPDRVPTVLRLYVPGL